jgi:hypothetical protein
VRLVVDNLLDNAALHGGDEVRVRLHAKGRPRRRRRRGRRPGLEAASARACWSRSPAAPASTRPARGWAWRSSRSRSPRTAGR